MTILNWVNQAYSYFKEKNFVKAAEIFKKLCLSQPEHHDGFNGLAFVYYAAGEFEKAAWFMEEESVYRYKFIAESDKDGNYVAIRGLAYEISFSKGLMTAQLTRLWIVALSIIVIAGATVIFTNEFTKPILTISSATEHLTTSIQELANTANTTSEKTTQVAEATKTMNKLSNDVSQNIAEGTNKVSALSVKIIEAKAVSEQAVASIEELNKLTIKEI